jgi:branched-chain amino acid transport system ATP-binding protein
LPNKNDKILRATDVTTGYGKKQVLFGVNIEIASGEIVAIIGHNGAGKSTLLKALFGLVPFWSGQVYLDGKSLRPRPDNLLRSGVAYVPQGNLVFTDLSVRENLEMGCLTLPQGASRDAEMERVLTLFPRLKSRLDQKARNLSGGEKQMLALSIAMVISPRLLLLDEPSLGLAPSLVTEAFDYIIQINQKSKTTFLIVEQKVLEILRVAHRAYVLRNGRVSFSGNTEELSEQRMREVYL